MNLNLKKVTYKNYGEVKYLHVAKGQE
ncbi:spermidine acetyltransferase, partial [Clostridium botulinum]|nr:spermidine acetyltransferase [Clostridium botulinum]